MTGSRTLTVLLEGLPEPFEVTVTSDQVKGTFRPFQVYDVYEDREEVVWLGLLTGEILRYDIGGTQGKDGTAWRLFTEADGLDITSGQVYRGLWPRITQTQDGVIWTVSWRNEGVNRFDGEAWTHFNLQDLGGLPATPPSWKHRMARSGSAAMAVSCTHIETMSGQSTRRPMCRFQQAGSTILWKHPMGHFGLQAGGRRLSGWMSGLLSGRPTTA